MISVIILSKNLKYAVLDVPANGKLQINEMHLVCGIVQNGVKCLPYGDVLSSFETFIQNETLSVGIIPHSEFQQEGRILDFTVIELLQLSTTIPMSASGSAVSFVPPTYTAGSQNYPVNYNLRLRHTNFTTAQMAQDWICGVSGGASTAMRDSVVNAITAPDSDGYQLLSVAFTQYNAWPSGLIDANTLVPNISELYDTGLLFVGTLGNYAINSRTMSILSLPGITKINDRIWNLGDKYDNFSLLDLPNLELIGDDNTVDVPATHLPNAYVPTGIQINVPRLFETCNAGGEHPTLIRLRNDKLWVINYLD